MEKHAHIVETLGPRRDSHLHRSSGSVKMLRSNLAKVSDHELMSRIKDGDGKAFQQLVRRYKDSLINYIYRIINDYDQAIDISQEVFIRVYRNAGTYKPLAAFSTWIYRIATNLSINELRRRRRSYTFSIFGGLHDYEEGFSEIRFADDSINDPEEETTLFQTRKRVREALDSLPVKYRIPLLLRELEGYSYEEIATIAQIPEGTVKSRINRGRAMLKKKLSAFMME